MVPLAPWIRLLVVRRRYADTDLIRAVEQESGESAARMRPCFYLLFVPALHFMLCDGVFVYQAAVVIDPVQSVKGKVRKLSARSWCIRFHADSFLFTDIVCCAVAGCHRCFPHDQPRWRHDGNGHGAH